MPRYKNRSQHRGVAYFQYLLKVGVLRHRVLASGSALTSIIMIYVYDCAGEVGPEAAARRPSRGAHQCGVPSHCLLQAGQQDPCSKQVRQASHPLLAALSPKIMFVTYCVCVWYVMAKMISLRTLHVGNMWFSHDQFLVLMLIIGGIVFFS